MWISLALRICLGQHKIYVQLKLNLITNPVHIIYPGPPSEALTNAHCLPSSLSWDFSHQPNYSCFSLSTNLLTLNISFRSSSFSQMVRFYFAALALCREPPSDSSSSFCLNAVAPGSPWSAFIHHWLQTLSPPSKLRSLGFLLHGLTFAKGLPTLWFMF